MSAPCPCPFTQPGRRGCLPLSPQGRSLPLPRGHEQRHGGCRSPPAAARRGAPGRGEPYARRSGASLPEAAGRARPQRRLPARRLCSQRAGRQRGAAFVCPHRAGQLPPAGRSAPRARPGLATHLRPGPARPALGRLPSAPLPAPRRNPARRARSAPHSAPAAPEGERRRGP